MAESLLPACVRPWATEIFSTRKKKKKKEQEEKEKKTAKIKALKDTVAAKHVDSQGQSLAH